MSDVIIQHDGSPLDHVAIAMSNLDSLCRTFAERSGVQPAIPDAHQGPVKSAAVHLGGEQALELLALNPDYDEPVHPLQARLASSTEPRVLFWYIGVDDIEAFARDAERAGLPLSAIEHLDVGTVRKHEFKRGTFKHLGFPAPSVIEWIARQSPDGRLPGGVTIKRFTLYAPEPDELHAQLERLGIFIQVKRDPVASLELLLDTPRGEVTFA